MRGIMHGTIRKSSMGFTEFTDLRDDPLQGAYGLCWFERKPGSLTPEESEQLNRAIGAGWISATEYQDWKENVR